MTQRQEEYREYLRSPEWQARRHLALEHAGGRCQVCNTSKCLHVHHRTYERVRCELPRDLTVLCEDCHALFHGKQKPAKPKPAKKSPKPARAKKACGPVSGVLSVVCPCCGAGVRRSCFSENGRSVKTHEVRRSFARGEPVPTPSRKPLSREDRLHAQRSPEQRKRLVEFRGGPFVG